MISQGVHRPLYQAVSEQNYPAGFDNVPELLVRISRVLLHCHSELTLNHSRISELAVSSSPESSRRCRQGTSPTLNRESFLLAEDNGSKQAVSLPHCQLPAGYGAGTSPSFFPLNPPRDIERTKEARFGVTARNRGHRSAAIIDSEADLADCEAYAEAARSPEILCQSERLSWEWTRAC